MSISSSLSNLVINDLKEMGIKHKEKKPKTIKIAVGQPLFRQGLQYLKLADAFLDNGTVVQVPQFIVESCSYILAHCETEGIFRKAGSAVKQREIRRCLEEGESVGKSHRVIDIANIVSYFFRELPEPLIPWYLHETLVRCLLTTEPYRIRSIQLTCLLIPFPTVQTLAYFMQFLHSVAMHCKSNKMSTENLATVIAPSVMPYRDINSVRFRNHIKIIELLIKNANIIGTVPVCIQEKLGNTSFNLLAGPMQTKNVRSEWSSIPKSKHRQSHIFSALKTKVGLSMSSSENLNCPSKQLDNSNTFINVANLQEKIYQETKTRSRIIQKTQRLTQPFNAFRANRIEKNNLNVNLPGIQGTINTGVNSVTRRSLDLRRSVKMVSSEASKNNIIGNVQHNLNNSTHNFGYTKEKYVHESLSLAKTSKNEFEAIKERVLTIENQILLPKEKITDCQSTYNNKPTGVNSLKEFKENCINAQAINERFKNRNFDKNLTGSSRKSSILRKPQEPLRIMRHNSCHKPPEVPVNLLFPKSKITNENKTIIQPQESKSDEWLPAERFFENLNNFQTPVKAITIQYEQNNTELDNFQNISYSISKLVNTTRNKTKHNETRIRSAKTVCRLYDSKLSSASNMIMDDQGRSSIARLRTENFGMVLAKAKLFDNLNVCSNKESNL